MAVALVVEIARLAVPVRPDRGAIDAHAATLRVKGCFATALPWLSPRRRCSGQPDLEDTMTARRFSLILALILVLAPTTARAGSQTGTWRLLPASPVTPEFNARTSVWTGKELLVFGRDQLTALDARGNPYATGRVNVAAAYNPRTKTWRRLAPPAKTSGFMDVNSVWTGKEMLVWGQGTHLAYDPATNRWQQLPSSRLLAVHDGFGTVVWTGHEMIGWGGGCCGDAFSDGVAYSPATNEWRALPRGPLPGSQHPLAAWTGKELIVLVGAHGAAYSPARNTWRTIATPPAHDRATSALWDGHELVVAGGSRAVLAYAPATNRWRHLPALPAGRAGKVVVWTGIELLVWGGNRGGAALVPGAARWTPLAHGPLPGRVEATAVWSGSSMIVWGGIPTKTWGKYA